MKKMFPLPNRGLKRCQGGYINVNGNGDFSFLPNRSVLNYRNKVGRVDAFQEERHELVPESPFEVWDHISSGDAGLFDFWENKGIDLAIQLVRKFHSDLITEATTDPYEVSTQNCDPDPFPVVDELIVLVLEGDIPRSNKDLKEVARCFLNSKLQMRTAYQSGKYRVEGEGIKKIVYGEQQGDFDAYRFWTDIVEFEPEDSSVESEDSSAESEVRLAGCSCSVM